MLIREATREDLATIAMVVSEANKDVAVRFRLNAENCPKHPSFCTEAWVASDLARGERYFILEESLDISSRKMTATKHRAEHAPTWPVRCCCRNPVPIPRHDPILLGCSLLAY
jgi:hypothetical protein